MTKKRSLYSTNPHYPQISKIDDKLAQLLNAETRRRFNSGETIIDNPSKIISLLDSDIEIISSFLVHYVRDFDKADSIQKYLKRIGDFSVISQLTKQFSDEHITSVWGKSQLGSFVPSEGNYLRGFIPSAYQVSIDAYKLLLSYSLVFSLGNRQLDDSSEDKISKISAFLIRRSEQRNSMYLGNQFGIGERIIEKIEINGPSIDNVNIIQNLSILERLYQNYKVIGELNVDKGLANQDLIDKSKPRFEEVLEYLCKVRSIGFERIKNSLLMYQTKLFDALWDFGEFQPTELKVVPIEVTARELRTITRNSLNDNEFENCLSSLIFGKEQALEAKPWNVGEREDTNLLYRPFVLANDKIMIYLPMLMNSFLCLCSKELLKIQSKSFDGIPFEGSVRDYITKLGGKVLSNTQKNVLQGRISRLSGFEAGQIDLVFFWRGTVFVAEIKSFEPKKSTPKEYRAILFYIQRAVEQLKRKVGAGSPNESAIIDEIKNAFKDEIPNRVVGIVIQQGYFGIDNFQGIPIINTFGLENFLISIPKAQ